MQPDQSISPKPKRHLSKKLLLIGASIIAVLAVALGTTILLSRLVPSKQTSQSQQQQAAATAKQKLTEAQNNEAKGSVDAALTSYKESLKSYQEAGDKSGEEGVKLQIDYLESVKENLQSTTTVTTVADPTQDPTYGMQLPR